MSESLQSNFYEPQYIVIFNRFIQQLKVIFPSEESIKLLSEIEDFPDHVKITRGQVFCSSIRDVNFDLFLKSKIKVFSHKSEDTQTISESLFGEKLSLKNLLNNQSDEVKKIIWTNLHTLCMISELLKPEELKDDEKVMQLNRVLYKDSDIPENNNFSDIPENNNFNSETKKKLQDMLGVNVNNETTSMIDDIVGSFEKVLTNQSGGNPLSGIMEISQTISVKYADKINKGEIELDKLMQAITSKIPGMEQMMDGMMGGMRGSKDQAKPKEKILMDENFSTANVEVGINQEPESKGMNISGILKMANQMGVIPGGKKSSHDSGMEEAMNGIPGIGKMMEMMTNQMGVIPGGKKSSHDSGMEEAMNGIPGIGKMMEMMTKLENTNTQEDAETLKLEMDSFLQYELGVDINKLNEQLESTTKQFQDQNKDI